jgi:molecular chaperone DnaJ
MAAKRDYYEVLELPRDASAEDVKKAFRRLALQYHPDRNKESGSDVRFKEISEAYQVLSDPERRAPYDRFGHAGLNGEAGRGFDGFDGFGGFGDIFDAFFSGSTGHGPRRGRDLECEVAIAFEDAAFGVEKQIDLDRIEACERCQGTRAEPGSETKTCATCGGHGQVRRLQRTVFGQFQQVAPCASCGGTGKLIKQPCTRCKGRGIEQRKRRIAVAVPAGIDDGARIRMRAQGEAGGSGASAGDLYVHVRVQPHASFERDGAHVHAIVDVNIAQAALGVELSVPTLDGPAKLKVRPGTQSGEQVRLSGKGFPELGGGRRGDHVVTVRVATPSRLDAQQKRLMEELAASLAGQPSDASGADRTRLFGRLKGALGGDERPS